MMYSKYLTLLVQAEFALAIGCRNLVVEEINGMRVVEVKTYLVEVRDALSNQL